MGWNLDPLFLWLSIDCIIVWGEAVRRNAPGEWSVPVETQKQPRVSVYVWYEGVADQIECDSGNCAFLQQPLPTVGETGN